MKLMLDIKQSLENCPPSKNPALKKIPERFLKDIVHVGRIRANPKNVIYRIDDQTRELKVVQSNVAPLKTSFEVGGFVHTEYPPVIMEDPDKTGHYLGIIGHTRDQVFKELNLDFMIYDVYKLIGRGRGSGCGIGYGCNRRLTGSFGIYLIVVKLTALILQSV